ncbi:heavy metal translocating P-type ATPase [Rhizobium sp. P28RR-XV]|uniref:heavy metal translocating P-type ATPase n=1 Tax=Rhizobium sp. P28RR-XV TaxID=2726737 RepID=UPI001456F0E7|nr:heavy metal translocating P-type ATPase [Rhizobium sp. P28RR-XV]NLR86147.1 cadmium-translocating P-type ATPase [Rhizobium sp. P28RR-XV]
MKFARRNRIETVLLLISLASLLLGLAFYFLVRSEAAKVVWSAGALTILAALLAEIFGDLRRGEIGLDIVAALSMSAALTFGETLAAAVVAVMYSGGAFLESFAEGRARREMQDLLSRVPRAATRHRDGELEDVPLEEIIPGDRLLVRQGDVVPVDGTIASALAFLDTSALTGESMPARLTMGSEAMSGSTNAAEAFYLTATRRAEESTYAGIIRLVDQAQRSKAPMSRLADRWSLGFLAITVALALAAWWFTEDPIRAVAVLVVATPCPLILAVPVALVAGVSRAAHFGVLIKGAKPLEMMARIRTLVLDKTGTLTDGRPRIISIDSYSDMPKDEILRLAAALDQASKHPVAQTIVTAAKQRGLTLPIPSDVEEIPGDGIVGTIDGRSVIVGDDDFVMQRLRQKTNGHSNLAAGSTLVAVAVDGRLTGCLIMADPLREGAAVVLNALRCEGITRIVLATGDRIEVAERITQGLGFDGLYAGLTPDQKVLTVLTERKNGPVMMVGDGINDAPALAAADVGVAMGVRGAAAAAEAADVILLVDRIDQLGAGLEIARRSRRIALESVGAGIGFSVLGMLAAAFGYLTPVEGAGLQEAIDVAVILNALRALHIQPYMAATAGQGSSHGLSQQTAA